MPFDGAGNAPARLGCPDANDSRDAGAPGEPACIAKHGQAMDRLFLAIFGIDEKACAGDSAARAGGFWMI